MRLAFLNRGRETHMGGDLVQLDATMDALRRKGVECVETGWDVRAIKNGNFDLCHVFHCQFDWSYGNYQAIQKANQRPDMFRADEIPYVLTPIAYPQLLSGITQTQLSEIVMNAKLVLPHSKREADELREQVGYFPYEAIPNGTDPAFHCTTRASDREGVLCVSARGPEDKGIPIVRAACERLGLPFTCVSGVPHDELPAIYAKHRIFVNASDSERMSLTVGEALCSGCRVISHDGNRGNGAYPQLASYHAQDDLLYWLQYAEDLMNESWSYAPNEAARAMTWDYVATELIKVYEWAVR